jgi:hypothetical protein
MSEPVTETARRRVGRSPSYPALDLGAALERTRVLYEAERRYSVALEVALRRLGYNSLKSGGGQVTIAALRYFGLIDTEGTGDSRRVQVTDEAEAILLDTRPDSRERDRRIQEAALRPPIHAELWQEYRERGLPSDENLRFELVRNRGFTTTGADDFIQEFRRTLEFAGFLTAGRANVSDENQDDTGAGAEETRKPSETSPNANQNTRKPALSGMVETDLQIPVPLLDGGLALLTLPRKMSEAAWRQMLGVLEAYKPAITSPPLDADSGDEEQPD